MRWRNSYNVPPVQMANLIGLGPIMRTAHRLGINSLTQASQYGLALALGSGEVSLLDLTYTYNVFNTSGYIWWGCRFTKTKARRDSAP